MRLLPPVRFQLWMNVRRAAILIRCSFVVFRRQFYWIQSWIQVPCGQVSFAFCSILVRLSSTGMNWIGCLVLQVIEMPEHNPGQMGGTMRLGKRRTVFKSDTSVMSMETLKYNIQLLLFALLQCLINNFYRKTLRECGFYRREAQTQIWSTAFFILFFFILHVCYVLPEVFQVLTSKHFCIVFIGEPFVEGPLRKTRSSVCGSGCAGRKNGDRRTGRWVGAFYYECLRARHWAL